MPITILEVAKARGAKIEADGTMTGQAFNDVGLDILGGCRTCGASIAAYNAYPTRSGYWSCHDCLSPAQGFSTVEDFELWCDLEDNHYDDQYNDDDSGEEHDDA